MTFLLINAILSFVLIAYSFSVDSQDTQRRDNSSIVNLILLLAATFLVNALCIICCKWASAQLIKVQSRITFTMYAWFAVYNWIFLLIIPNGKKNVPITVIQWILNILAVAIVFLAPDGFKAITYTEGSGLKVISSPVFYGALFDYLPITWFQLYVIIYWIFLPFIGFISILVRSEMMKTKLEKQRMKLNAFAVVVFWALSYLIAWSQRIQPQLSTLVLVPYIFEILLLVKAGNLDSVWDFKTGSRSTARFIIKYLIPSVIVGGLSALIMASFGANTLIIALLTVVITGGVIATWYQIDKHMTAKNILADNNYATHFEDQLASLDYSGDTKDITSNLFNIFKSNLSTTSLQILIDGGVGDLETVYSSNDKHNKIDINNNCFDFLLNINHPIVFREFAKHNYKVMSIRHELTKLLDDNDSDAFILLNEGRHIVGIIFLGKKKSGNVYNDYDYQTFTKLYSYFFVVGYYMKNISNESVVGTVNREIRMSSQIITSIQENMDPINSKKIDAGYCMVPAHNIGGEFIDLIRLTDTRHLFLIGSMSGKGIAASMSMVILKSVIRTYLAETADFKKLVVKINEFVRDGLPKGTYFSGLFGLLDFNTDTMYYINCGCPALLTYTKAYNNVIEIQGEGRVLGFVKDIDPLVKVKKVKLAPGDIVLATTQGLIETHSLRGEIFGKERIQKSLLENSRYSAEKMAKFTYDSLVQFTSKEIDDDVTILVFKYLGGK